MIEDNCPKPMVDSCWFLIIISACHFSPMQWYMSMGEHGYVQSLLALLHQTEKVTAVEHTHVFTDEDLDDGTLSDRRTAFKQPGAVTTTSRRSMRQSIAPVTTASHRPCDSVDRFIDRSDARDHAWTHLLSTKQYSKVWMVVLCFI